MAFDAEIIEGFDKYKPAQTVDFSSALDEMAGEWSALSHLARFVPALAGEGYALRLNNDSSSGDARLTRSLGDNYARVIGGCFIQSTPNRSSSAQRNGVILWDGGTVQANIRITIDGFIEYLRGSTTVETSAVQIPNDSINCIEWDITFHNSAGIAKIYLNGELVIDFAGDTINSSNAYANTFSLNVVGSFTNACVYDHLYLRLFLAGGSEDTVLGCPIVETQFPDADFQAEFTPGPGVLGRTYRVTTGTVNLSANRIGFRKFVAATDCDLESIKFITNTTSAGVKIRPVVYADSAGAPGALLGSGPDITGTTGSATTTCPLTAPVALSKGSTYWLGIMTDTTTAMWLQDTGADGYIATATFSSGAPDPAPAVTAGQGSYLLSGVLSGADENFAQVGDFAMDGSSYNTSDTVGAEDIYSFPALVSVPETVHSVKVSARAYSDDGGARTLDLRTKSGETVASGSDAGFTPSTSGQWFSSYFPFNPNTSGAEWTGVAVNNADHGIQIAS